MEKCLQCNSTLTPSEKECWGCGNPVPEKNPKKSMPEHFRGVVKVLFIVFCILTPVSLFTDYAPSIGKCFGGLVVTYLVKNSLEHMVDNARKA